MSGSFAGERSIPRSFVVERLASGRVLVRHALVDHAIARETAPLLEDAFARHESLAVAGARRLARDGIAAHGAFLLHPKGIVRNGRTAPRDAERFDVEVDAIDHGVAVVAPEAFDAVRGDDLCDPMVGFGALALIAISLESRRRGHGRTLSIAAATIEESAGAEDAFDREGFRSTIASAHFRNHLGFDGEACDLDAVATSEAHRRLRWNPAIWGAPAGFGKYEARGAYHWDLYETHDAYRRRADTLVSFLLANLGQDRATASLPILDIGSGDGLFAGLLARHALHVSAVEPEREAIAIADARFAAEGLADLVTTIAGSAESLPFPARSARGALVLDVIEHLRNPVRALAEIRRVVAPGGRVLFATPAWKYGHRNDPVYHLDEYREEELVRQLAACGLSVVQTARIRGAYDDIVVLAST
ncbi:MAG: class I SAM-dependent methyltransferase [bacterium]